MTIADAWAGLVGDDGTPCGYTHDDHVQDGEALVCVRGAGHPGTRVARDMHLAVVAGEPVFFGDPLPIEEVTPG